MSKVYIKKYTNNSAPKALPALIVTAGNLRSVQVGFPSEGFLTRIVVKQTDGTAVAFVVELLDSMIPYPPGEQPVATVPADDIELYRIVDQQAAASGATINLVSSTSGYPFHNADGSFSDNQRYLYLVIKPTSAGTDTTFDVALTAYTDVS